MDVSRLQEKMPFSEHKQEHNTYCYTRMITFLSNLVEDVLTPWPGQASLISLVVGCLLNISLVHTEVWILAAGHRLFN